VRRLVAVMLFGVGAACGYADLNGDPIADEGAVNLPDRSKGSEDAGSPVVNSSSSSSSSSSSGGAVEDAKPPSVTCQPTTLAMCFRFEGNTVDLSGAIAPLESTGIAFVPGGKEDQAAQFNANSALRFAPNPAFDLPANGAAIEAWIRRDATGADAVVFDDDARFSLTINAAGKVWCKSSGGAVIGATTVPVGQWAHVACVIDSGQLRAYMNGVEDAVGAGTIVASPGSAAAIGGNSPSGEPFIGLIDSFRVFKVARSAAEIAAAAKP